MEETYGRLLCNRRMVIIKFILLYHLSLPVDVFVNGFWKKRIKNID